MYKDAPAKAPDKLQMSRIGKNLLGKQAPSAHEICKPENKQKHFVKIQQSKYVHFR